MAQQLNLYIYPIKCNFPYFNLFTKKAVHFLSNIYCIYASLILK